MLYDSRENRVHDWEYDTEKQRPPESINSKAINDIGYDYDDKSIYYQSKKSYSHYVYWQRQK